MARFDLTDFEWSVIQPLLLTKVCGVKWGDDRRVLNGTADPVFHGLTSRTAMGRIRRA